MSEPGSELIIRRILVALDASSHSLAALEAAAELAADLKAELLGLFVEDINLVRLAELSFARAIHYPSATERQLDSPGVERELRVQAAQARQSLAAVAERVRVRWSFQTVRGRVVSELLTAAREADLLTLGKASRPLGGRVRLGSTARAVAAGAPRSVLLLQRGACIGKPVLVTYDGSVGSRQGLALGARLAQADADKLTVLVMADSPETAQRLEGQAADWLRARGLAARYRRVTGDRVRALAQAVRAEGGGVLVLGGEPVLLENEAIQQLLDELPCPVLLVR